MKLPALKNGGVWKAEVHIWCEVELFWLGKMFKATNTGENGFSAGTRYERMLVELFRKRSLQSFADCVRKFVLVQRRHVYDGDIRRKIVKYGFLNGGFCPTLREYDSLGTRTEIPETGVYALHEQRVYFDSCVWC